MTTVDFQGLTEAEVARLLQRVEWTAWGHWQSVHVRVGKGATTFLRQTAERLGLRAQVQRAGVDVVYIKLEASE